MFSSETAGNATDFLYTQPISRWKIAASKVLAGLIFIIVIAVLSTVVLRLIRPEAYAAFTAFPHLAAGTGQTITVLGIGFITGAS